VAIELDEAAIPINEAVKGACEIMGFDPLYVANEGKCLAIVERARAEAVLDAWRRHPLGARAAIIGEVREAPRGRVILRTRIGARRVVDMLSGDQLPRIC
jgi:hydrogenase expression/formation protein HypE